LPGCFTVTENMSLADLSTTAFTSRNIGGGFRPATLRSRHFYRVLLRPFARDHGSQQASRIHSLSRSRTHAERELISTSPQLEMVLHSGTSRTRIQFIDQSVLKELALFIVDPEKRVCILWDQQ
jgi:hypothetical protein